MNESAARAAQAGATRAARLFFRSRWLVRAPIWLYRARLGFMFGSGLLMLEHTGRKTGARRYVVLEVLGRPRPGSYVVASGWNHAQWYRNIQASPQVRVSVGRRVRAAATARQLTSDEAAAILDGYAQHHPRAWATLRPVLENTIGAALSSLPMIALEIAGGPASRDHDRGSAAPPRPEDQ